MNEKPWKKYNKKQINFKQYHFTFCSISHQMQYDKNRLQALIFLDSYLQKFPGQFYEISNNKGESTRKN